MISRDAKVLESGNAVSLRMQEYAKLFDELHIVLLRGNIFSFLKTFISVSNLARKMGRNDWITSQDPFESGIVALVIAKIWGLQLQLQLHTDVFSPYFAKLSILNHIRVMIARRVLRHADSIRVVSNRIKESIATNLKSKLHMPIEVRPIEVNTEKIKNAPIVVDLHRKYPQFKKIILMVGRLEKEKNYQMALAAFAVVRAKLPSIGLIIVGEGRMKLNAGANVIIESWSDQIYSYMKTADILLHTSWYEGYGMVLKEAEACGSPIVSKDVGIAREVGARIVKHDTESIAQGIMEKLQ